MMIYYQDTISAIATPPGRGGVGIIRISGPKAKLIGEEMTQKVISQGKILFSRFYAKENEIVDEGLILFFKGPHSFTGEDVVELQGHGGPVILDCLLQETIKQGARLAEPGEFSKRAFLNNKIDLLQAEAIADLIDASSLQAAKSASRSLQGEFSNKINGLVEKLIHLRMYVEAAIDFPEEEINFLSDGKVQADLEAIIQKLDEVCEAAKQGALLREGMVIAIAGKPNAGKSSLLNALSQQDRAIVTDIPGTTRDILREHIQLDGMPLHIIDTAGLRDTNDPIEQEGIRRAWLAIEEADEILVVMDALDKDQKIIQCWKNKLGSRVTIIKNKIDLLDETPSISSLKGLDLISLSAKKQEGIDLLKQHLKNKMGYKEQNEGLFIARKRHLHALEQAKIALEQAWQQLTVFNAGECVAEELKIAQEHLSHITGEFNSDDLLGKIFSSFCIGK